VRKISEDSPHKFSSGRTVIYKKLVGRLFSLYTVKKRFPLKKQEAFFCVLILLPDGLICAFGSIAAVSWQFIVV